MICYLGMRSKRFLIDFLTLSPKKLFSRISETKPEAKKAGPLPTLPRSMKIGYLHLNAAKNILQISSSPFPCILNKGEKEGSFVLYLSWFKSQGTW
jgi:hypothetical protein